MKMEILECTNLNIKVRLYAPISFANAIRRILLGEVPTAAIDLIEIKENKSVLADEMIANRLGLIPIKINRDLILKTECDCDSYCSRCSVTFTLAESNRTEKILALTGKNLHVDTPGDAECHDSLIVKLAQGQSIDIKCIARRGAPLSHAKYCPVTAVSFVYDPQNKHRETNLWFEEDVRREWPMVNQGDEVEWDDCKEVEMDVEIVEGVGNPKDIFMSALCVFKEKMQRILEEVDS